MRGMKFCLFVPVVGSLLIQGIALPFPHQPSNNGFYVPRNRFQGTGLSSGFHGGSGNTYSNGFQGGGFGGQNSFGGFQNAFQNQPPGFGGSNNGFNMNNPGFVAFNPAFGGFFGSALPTGQSGFHPTIGNNGNQVIGSPSGAVTQNLQPAPHSGGAHPNIEKVLKSKPSKQVISNPNDDRHHKQEPHDNDHHQQTPPTPDSNTQTQRPGSLHLHCVPYKHYYDYCLPHSHR